MHTQHCSHWCPGTKASGHQYLEYWLIFIILNQCHRVITIIVSNIRKQNCISNKLAQLFQDKQTTTVQYMWCIHPIPHPFPCPRPLPSAPYHVTKVCMFVVVNFDALAQASDFRTERRQVVFLCWMPDSNQGLWNRISSRLNARWQTDWAIDNQAKKNNSIARPYVDPLLPVSAQRPISCNKNMDVVTQHKKMEYGLPFTSLDSYPAS